MPSVIITEVPLGLKVPQSWKLKNEVFQLESSEELFTNHFTGIHYHHPQCQTDEKWKGEPYQILIFCSFRWQNRKLRSITLETNLIILRKKKHRFCQDYLMIQRRQTRYPFTDLPHWQIQLIFKAVPETIKLDFQGGPSIWAVYPRHKVTKYVQGRRGQSSRYARNSGHRMRHVAREIFASGSGVHRLSELFQLYTWFFLENHVLYPTRQQMPM